MAKYLYKKKIFVISLPNLKSFLFFLIYSNCVCVCACVYVHKSVGAWQRPEEDAGVPEVGVRWS